jgi:hypothetical protein
VPILHWPLTYSADFSGPSVQRSTFNVDSPSPTPPLHLVDSARYGRADRSSLSSWFPGPVACAHLGLVGNFSAAVRAHFLPVSTSSPHPFTHRASPRSQTAVTSMERWTSGRRNGGLVDETLEACVAGDTQRRTVTDRTTVWIAEKRENYRDRYLIPTTVREGVLIPGTLSPGSCRSFVYFRPAKIANFCAVTCDVPRHWLT